MLPDLILKCNYVAPRREGASRLVVSDEYIGRERVSLCSFFWTPERSSDALCGDVSRQHSGARTDNNEQPAIQPVRAAITAPRP
ncbi:MAG: hypothetical protein QM739_17740 [Propionivibrio sp.]